MAADTGLHGGGVPAPAGLGGPSGGPSAVSSGGPWGGLSHDGVHSDMDYFSIGMVVELMTKGKKPLRGEVVAFDLTSKLLAIKCPSTSGVHGRNDVQIVNLSFVSDIKTISEAQEHSLQPLPNLNFSKLHSRVSNNLSERMVKIGYTGVGVSALAQRLVNTITKTITEVRWEGQNIIVLDQVTISPPYDIASCRLIDGQALQVNEHALQHVQKMVGKFHKENGEPSTTAMSPK